MHPALRSAIPKYSCTYARLSFDSTTSSEESRNSETYFDILESLVLRAWSKCTLDCCQLIIMGLVDNGYWKQYYEQNITDLGSFDRFYSYIKAPTFRKRMVWHAWGFIRPLVVKYIEVEPVGEQCHSHMKRLNSIRDKWFQPFWLLARVDRFHYLGKIDARPTRIVTEQEWESLRKDVRGRALDGVMQMLGIEKLSAEPWRYEDIFRYERNDFPEGIGRYKSF
jgi:hypothetical protein